METGNKAMMKMGNAFFERLVRTYRNILLLTVMLLVVSPPTYSQVSARDIVRDNAEFVLRIAHGEQKGTGFYDKNGYIWTAYHVIKPGDRPIYATDAEGNTRQAKIIFQDQSRDFAILKPADKSYGGMPFADYSRTEVGEPIFVLGHPKGLSLAITQGILSSKEDFDSISLTQISANISPGSSGSPVLNEFGEVVGMVIFYIKDGQNLNYAISTRDMKLHGINKCKEYIDIDPEKFWLRIAKALKEKVFDANDVGLSTVDFVIKLLYAVHGYRFKTIDDAALYKDYSWYKPDTNNLSVVRSRMNKIELANLKILQKRKQVIQSN